MDEARVGCITADFSLGATGGLLGRILSMLVIVITARARGCSARRDNLRLW
jgi:hypothetical protein